MNHCFNYFLAYNQLLNVETNIDFEEGIGVLRLF